MRVSMNKQRASGRKDGYACISGLADICERPHYEQCIASHASEQRKAARAAAVGRGANVWGDNKPLRGLRELVRAEQRVVYSYMFAGTRPWPQI